MDTNGVCMSRDTGVTFASPLPSRYSSERGMHAGPGLSPVSGGRSLVPAHRKARIGSPAEALVIAHPSHRPLARDAIFPAEAVRGCPPPRASTRSLLANSFSQHWEALRSLCCFQYSTRTECTSSVFPWAHVHASVGRRDHLSAAGSVRVMGGVRRKAG